MTMLEKLEAYVAARPDADINTLAVGFQFDNRNHFLKRLIVEAMERHTENTGALQIGDLEEALFFALKHMDSSQRAMWLWDMFEENVELADIIERRNGGA